MPGLVDARRLEIRQNKNYGQDPEYQAYVKSVPILLPFIPLYSVEKYKFLRANLYYRTDHYFYCNSSVIELLINSRWLYNPSNRRVSPKEITREELSEVGYMHSSAICDILGIKRKIADLTEYGLSSADNEAFQIGNKAKELGLSPEDLEEAAKRKKAKEEPLTMLLCHQLLDEIAFICEDSIENDG